MHATPSIRRVTRAALAVVALFSAATVQADVAHAQVGPTATTDFVLNVAGIQSWGLFSDPLNTRRTLNIGANSRVVGLGWSFSQTATSPSLLSEMTVLIGSSFQSYLGLVGEETDTFSGTRSYSSGGVLDLIGAGADFFVLPDGLVQFEFFESGNDDRPMAADGVWNSGTLTLRVAPAQVVPEPTTIVLMATGLLTLGVVARRRVRASPTSRA